MNGTVAPSARSFTTAPTLARGRFSSADRAGTGSKLKTRGFAAPSEKSPAVEEEELSVVMGAWGIPARGTPVQP